MVIEVLLCFQLSCDMMEPDEYACANMNMKCVIAMNMNIRDRIRIKYRAGKYCMGVLWICILNSENSEFSPNFPRSGRFLMPAKIWPLLFVCCLLLCGELCRLGCLVFPSTFEGCFLILWRVGGVWIRLLGVLVRWRGEEKCASTKRKKVLVREISNYSNLIRNYICTITVENQTEVSV